MNMKSLFRSIVEYFPSSALLFRTLRDQMDLGQIPKMTPWGFSLAGHEGMAAGAFEPQETKLVRHLLGKVDLLVNAGANVGYYSPANYDLYIAMAKSILIVINQQDYI